MAAWRRWRRLSIVNCRLWVAVLAVGSPRLLALLGTYLSIGMLYLVGQFLVYTYTVDVGIRTNLSLWHNICTVPIPTKKLRYFMTHISTGGMS